LPVRSTRSQCFRDTNERDGAAVRRACLQEDDAGVGEGLEEVVGGPADGAGGVAALVARHVAAELDDAPGQHGGGERHGEAELDVVAGVVVAALEVDPGCGAVRHAGVPAPRRALARREPPRALALEEEDGLGQRVTVVVPLGGRGEAEERGRAGRHEPVRRQEGR